MRSRPEDTAHYRDEEDEVLAEDPDEELVVHPVREEDVFDLPLVQLLHLQQDRENST